MRALVQRVSKASVVVHDEIIAQIDHGLLIFICTMAGDNDMQARFLARKIVALRIFEDENGKMNRSVLDVDGATIIVSQFTLCGDTSRGNRPGFSRAARLENKGSRFRWDDSALI